MLGRMLFHYLGVAQQRASAAAEAAVQVPETATASRPVAVSRVSGAHALMPKLAVVLLHAGC